ncbi:MAG: succinyl-diaminopimelate desuccinylase [Acidimicrobiia bacterium]|nr:succinyl-diaminopimelate desuccinylase [Acidimicrobiia bacterium]MDH3397119.1 succinyl-diaminopimelate desuccinylase [Acidimicrobiia bacterium]
MSDLISTLVDLIDVPSEIGDEGRLCTSLAERLMSTWGMDGVERIGNSLIVGKRSQRPLVLLVGHIDTVPAQGNGPATIEEGRVIGLGASDMKSGLAVMVHLLEDPSVRLGPYDVVGLFYDKEEGPVDDNGLEPVLQRAPWLAEAEFAVVLEPTDLELQVGCIGTINATVRFEGYSAHSARPWLGENAITKAGSWLAELHARLPESIIIDGLEFKEVFSVTTASGGIARNIIPASFELNLNYRFAPDKTLDEAEANLREVAAAADGIEIVDRAPPGPVPRGNSYFERLAAMSGAACTPKQAWTDVARLAQHGIPAVNYGPGETAQAHQAAESVAVVNLPVVFEALLRFLS